MNDGLMYKGMAWGFAGFTSFTLADAAVKELSDQFESLQLSFMFSLFALVLLFLFSPFLGGVKDTFCTPKWKILWGRGLVLGMQGITAVMAFGLLPFVKVYTLLFIAPFLALFMSIIIFKDKVGWRRWLAILAGFSGVMIALRPGVIPLEIGALVALTCGALAASSWILVRYIGEGQTLMSYAAYPLICSVFITAYPAFTDFVMPTDMTQILLIVAGSICGLGGIMMLSHAFRIAPAGVVSPFHYTQLIFAVLWGYLFFSEFPDHWTIMGSVVILASGLFIVFREHKRGL